MSEDELKAGSQLTDEQIMNFGQMAAQAFQNPLFVIWHNLMLQRTMEAIDSAPPEHTKEVMWQKARRDVLADMARDFQSMIQNAEVVLARHQKRNSPEQKQKDYEDQQGFGLDFGQGGTA
jgi:hypothetical protein